MLEEGEEVLMKWELRRNDATRDQITNLWWGYQPHDLTGISSTR